MKTWIFSCALVLSISSLACGDQVFFGSGTSAKGTPVEFTATFKISGNFLTLCLENVSSVDPLNPDDLISSLYFDIIDAGSLRPTLTNYAATGDVWTTSKNDADVLTTAGADLAAFNVGDDTWQFKDDFDESQNPFARFGVSTVGNATIAPNGFNGNITGAINYSIFTGEITTQNLNDKLLVKDKITFTWQGASGFSENDISNVTFGLGTGPDSLIKGVPEPASGLMLLAMFGICAAGYRRKKA